MDSNKPAQNIQDSFLNTARKERLSITIYLLSGVKLTGRIRSFDKYSVVLEANGQEQLIFKHAISTVVMGTSGVDACGPHAASGEGSGRGNGARAGAAPSGRALRDTERIRRFRFGTFSHQEIPRHGACRQTCASGNRESCAKNRSVERAFLVGIDVRTRGRSGAKGEVTAQAAVAREAAAMQPQAGRCGKVERQAPNS